MRHLFLVLILLSIICHIQLIAQIPTNGLVAYYPFNGNANDESGNGNNGTVNGATLTTDRFGSANRAYSFNGQNSYISINSIAGLSGQSLSSITFSAWIKCDGHIYSEHGKIFEMITQSPNEFFLDAKKSGNYYYLEYVLHDHLITTGQLEYGKWYFVTLLFTGSEQKMYVDASLISTTQWGGPFPLSGGMSIGMDLWPGGIFYFQGLIDDIRIYNRSLSPDEINSLYHEGGWMVPTITSFSPTSATIGSTVTITGTNFNPTANKNIVYFGGVKATVTNATSTSLSVTVPAGAAYAPIAVTDTTTGLTACSHKDFIVTFKSAGIIDSNCFAWKWDVPVGVNPTESRIVDINADGKPDLVVVNQGSESFSVFKNQSTSGVLSFDSKQDFSTGSGSYPRSVTSADIDGDGKLDLIISNQNGGTIAIYRNISMGNSTSFDQPYTISVGNLPHYIAISDFNKDGKLDIVVAIYGFNSVKLYQNNSTVGNISVSFIQEILTGLNPYWVVSVDFDDDGKSDLAVSNLNSNTISILRNVTTDSNINFDPKVDINTGDKPHSIFTGDIDGDSKPDLVLTHDHSSFISIWRNTSTVGNITFSTKLDFTTTGAQQHTLSGGDINGDGRVDLVLGKYWTDNVSVFQNKSAIGTISFSNRQEYQVNVDPYWVTAGDLDGDGKPEIIASNYSSNNISILRNQIPDNIPPAAPTGLVAYAGNGKVTLRWNKNTEEDFLRYRIYRGTSPNPTVKIDSSTGGINDTSKVISNLVNGTTYHLRITAVDSSGLESGYSNNVSATPDVVSICVSTTGGDGNIGTPSEPLRNIQTALTRAGYGDTIKVASGIYVGNLTTTTSVVLRGGYSSSFSESTRDIFQNKTTIRASSGNLLNVSHDIAVDGFVFDASLHGNNTYPRAFNILNGFATITHNVITGFAASGGIGITFTASGTGALIKNNTIIPNTTSGSGATFTGIFYGSSCDPATRIENNIITRGYEGISKPSGSTYDDYNCVYDNSYSNYSAPGPHDINLAPKLVYPAGGDFRLRGGSPCIDAGNPSDPVGNEPIPNGNCIDIGAYGGTNNATKTGWNPATHVSNNGSDANNGSAAAPYLTIQYALTHSLGDTIKVASGTYAEAIVTASQGYLRGGYSETFSEAERNIHQYRTTLQAVGSSIITDNFGLNVDGFFFDGMTDVADYGIDVKKATLISHNVFLNFKKTWAHSINTIAGVNIINNTFYNCYYALWLDNKATGCSIKNNIFSTNNYAFYNLAANGMMSYNDLYNSPRAGVYGDPGIGEIGLNPLFRNIAGRDFRLQATSPCINAGDPDPQYNDPDGSRNDMGVFFYDTPPAAPTGLVAIAADGQVSLKWNKNIEADILRYHIYGGTSPNPTTKIDSTTGGISDTTKTISGLNRNVTYYFRIKAVDNSKQESGFSNEVSAKPMPPLPVAVNLISPSNNDMNLPRTVTLKWNRLSSASAYRLQVGTDSTFSSGIIFDDSTLTDTTKSINTLANGTAYYWRVNARNMTGTGPWSEVRKFTTRLAAPQLTASPLSPTKITLNWTLISGAVAYRLMRGFDSTSLSYRGEVAVTSLNDSLLTPSTKYYYRIVTVDIYNQLGDTSYAVWAVTNPATPINLTVNKVADKYIQFSWSSGGGVPSLYKIFRSTDGTQYVLYDTTSQVLYTDTSVTPFTPYWYRLIAVNSVGVMSDTSAVLYAKTLRLLPRISGIQESPMWVRDVWFTYSLTVPSGDTVNLVCYYSLDSGRTYTQTSNITGKYSNILSSTQDTVFWKSNVDRPNTEVLYARFKIIPIGLGGAGDSLVSGVHPLDNKPPEFAGISKAVGDTNRVTLTWSKATDMSGGIRYKIYGGLEEDTVGLYAETTDTVFIKNGLPNFRYYKFNVRSEDAIKNLDTNTILLKALTGVRSRISSVVLPGTRLAGNVRVTYQVNSQQGDSVKAAMLYSVDGGSSFNTASVEKEAPVRTTFPKTDTLIWNSANNTLNETDKAYIKIATTGRMGVGRADSSQKFTIDNEPPRFNGAKSVESIVWNKAVVRWDKAVDMSSPITYQVFKSLTIEFNYAKSDTSVVSVDSVILSGLKSAATWYFVIRAQDDLKNQDTNTIVQSTFRPSVGDYDKDFDIDAPDLNRFISAWSYGHKDSADFHPCSPSVDSIPYITVIGDNKLDRNDYFIFAKMWWYARAIGLPHPGLAKAVKRTFAEERRIGINLERRQKEVKNFLNLSIDLPTAAAGIEIHYGSTLTLDSMKVIADGYALTYNDTLRRIVYIDYAKLGGIILGEKEFAFLKWNRNPEPISDSIEVFITAYDMLLHKYVEKRIVYELIAIPKQYALYQNYPNPFNAMTIVEFDVPEVGNISLKVYDLLGREVMTLAEGIYKPGYYKVSLNGHKLSSGAYFCRFKSHKYTAVKKLMLVK